MKRFVSICISISLVFGIMTIPSHASTYTDSNMQDAAFVDSNSITVTQENFQRIIVDYDVPKEVAEALASRISQAEAGVVVTLLVPYEENADGGAEMQSTTSTWSPIRMYEGHQLSDWVITINNSHSPTNIVSQACENNILSFTGTVMAYAGGVLLDTVCSFGSAIITAAQYILGRETNTIRPSSGDILTAAPQYTCYDTFTYVIEGGEYYLGVRTYAAYVKQITWFAYCAAEDEQNTVIGTMPGNFKSTNYSNRNKMAVQWYVLGGWSDSPIYIEIGDCQFLLN